jgi:very-short-patch-repair endonuclease
MPGKASDTDFENAVDAYVAGESVENAAGRFRTGEKRLKDALKERGLWRDAATTRRLATSHSTATRLAQSNLPQDEIVARYVDGESEKALADAFGVSRSVIARRLALAGVSRRDPTQANRLMMSVRTPDENRRNVAAANAACRGRTHSVEEKMLRAQRRQERRTHTSSDELTLAAMLQKRGVDVIHQQAVGIYNIDLGAYPVAVEVYGGHWHSSADHASRAPERFRYLLDSGWAVVIVWIDSRRYPLSVAAADYIAAFAQETCRNPALQGQYRVIRGDGEVVASDRFNVEDFSRIPAGGSGKYPRR